MWFTGDVNTDVLTAVTHGPDRRVTMIAIDAHDIHLILGQDPDPGMKSSAMQ